MWESRDSNCGKVGILIVAIKGSSNPIHKSVLSMVRDPKRLIGSMRNHDDLTRCLENRCSVGSTWVA